MGAGRVFEDRLRRLLLALTLAAAIGSVAAAAPAHAVESPVGAARAAHSSWQEEPAIEVGPPGQTLVADEETERVGPGVTLTTFDRFDARGWIRGYVLEVDLSTPSVSTDLLFPGAVAAAEPLSASAARAGAIAAVNGDFFDIGNTKAPLGAEIVGGELIKGPESGWNNHVGVGADRLGRLAQVFLEGTVVLPSGSVPLDALNMPGIPRHGIGLYTSAWGSFSRATVVEPGTPVREVTVRDGVVTSVSPMLSTGPIAPGSQVLIGRDTAANSLADLRLGDSVSVEYRARTDSPSPLRFAVGGNVVLVRDGELPSLDDRESHPRTAVGFSADGRTMLLAAIDGRQRDSRGMTLRELGDLLRRLGADDALNLDGGGSTTVLAREPGEADAELVNNPSDGIERSVPNGLGVFIARGSGLLSGFDVEPTSEHQLAARVFPGLSRTFVGRGYDESYAPAPTGEIDWQALPADVGRFEAPGVFRAARPGSALVEAQARNAKGTTPLRVLGKLTRIEATPGRLGLATGVTGVFGVAGYDGNGYSAPLEPRDVALLYDSAVATISAMPDGSFRVVPVTDSGSTVLLIAVQGKVAHLPITVGLTSVVVSEFDDASKWTFATARASGSMSFVPARTGNGLRLSYRFNESTGTRAAYANARPLLELPGQPQRIGMWVNGDGKGAWLRTVIRDAANVAYTLNLAASVNWTGWQYVETTVPPGVQYPLRFWRVYPVETVPARQYTGELVFDDLTVKLTPSTTVPEEQLIRDPLIVEQGSLEPGRWRFAVLADSQFVAASPDSKEVRLARESLREILAASPDFLVISGDFVDTAWPQDFDLADRILQEEVAGRVPIYYIPGNHEIMGPGTLSNFLAEFERNRYTFDHKGTRFILLDSSTGSFRTAEFQQLIDLKATLDEAASDPRVKNVVVSAHHPPRDPLPTENSQLGDRKEARLLEQWLTEFRDRSGGKGAIYIGGHAHTVSLERVEGVPYMVVGPAGKAPYAAPDGGGFYAWTLFGVDPTPQPDQGRGPGSPRRIGLDEWIRAEVRPLLERISLQAPAAIAAGATVTVKATGHQAGGLAFPLRYPASVTWTASTNIFVGGGEAARRAVTSGRYDATFDPQTQELHTLRPASGTLRVTANGKTAELAVAIAAAEAA